jgi:hypothetical protein
VRRLISRVLVTIALVTPFALAARPARAADLPPGLARSLASRTAIVTAIAADIDADGDVDVVASDAALQLHVWINDGAGHFTERAPARRTTWDPLPAGPTLDGRETPSQSFTPTTPSTVGDDARWIPWIPPSAAAIALAIAGVPASLDRSTAAPRAPPASAR